MYVNTSQQASRTVDRRNPKRPPTGGARHAERTSAARAEHIATASLSGVASSAAGECLWVAPDEGQSLIRLTLGPGGYGDSWPVDLAALFPALPGGRWTSKGSPSSAHAVDQRRLARSNGGACSPLCRSGCCEVFQGGQATS